MEWTGRELVSSRRYPEEYGCCIGSVQSDDRGTIEDLAVCVYEIELSPHPAREAKAAWENPRHPRMPETTMTNHTAFTGVWVWWFIFFHQRDPGRALSLANANTTREASTPWAAPVTYYSIERLSTVVIHNVERKTPTWTTITKLHIASMPRFPRVSKNNCPIGNGRVVFKRSGTDEVA